MVLALTNELHIDASDIIPLETWLDLVASASDENNPAQNLTSFFRTEFQKMSSGEIVLDTSVSRSVSATLRRMGPVGEEYLRAYVAYWRSIGFLK
jgi:hypothetical protein